MEELRVGDRTVKVKSIKLPSGLTIKIGEWDEDELFVYFVEPKYGNPVQMRVPKYKLVGKEKSPITPEDIDKRINRFLYGYDDPSSGEHIKGYYELIEERKKKLEEEQKKKAEEWWA